MKYRLENSKEKLESARVLLDAGKCNVVKKDKNKNT